LYGDAKVCVGNVQNVALPDKINQVFSLNTDLSVPEIGHILKKTDTFPLCYVLK